MEGAIAFEGVSDAKQFPAGIAALDLIHQCNEASVLERQAAIQQNLTLSCS